MIFGTLFAGKIKTQNKQYIATKILCIFIPIFPLSSMLVVNKDGNERSGIEIMKNGYSIIAFILRIAALAFFVYYTIIERNNYFENEYIRSLKTGIISLLVIYFWFFFGKTTKKEEFVRDQFGKTFGLFFMPEWLYLEDFERFNETAKKTFRITNTEDNWIDKLNSTKYSNADFALVYSLSYFENILKPNARVQQILQKKYEQFLNETKKVTK